ncbi:MAG: 2,3-bisphosphoglycerate-independent phosphoglycerate mutase [Tannerella sp.]|jgi:2,3-bisphosphoglycerate-independent phosphoglycerate mutase|nr:2,3-bisphosphoglycerate-independent phosphoglycerate mutase [Tannerella sp.]
MKNSLKPTMLIILDGYGQSDTSYGNAIAAARKPDIDKLFEKYPHTTLEASGLSVGLPDGQMGNSEVGHLNIGAGRIVYQDLTRISKEIDDGTFFENEPLLSAIAHVKKNNSALHLMGLVSDGGVHSHISHIFALIDMAHKHSLEKVYVHCFLDGRDVPPRSALLYIEQLELYMKKVGVGQIATVSGRYYAMDRDERWERVEKGYNALTLGDGKLANTALEAVNNAYARDENDEFVVPTVIKHPNVAANTAPNCTGKTETEIFDSVNATEALVNDGDAMIMFNFRPDRAREITRAFVDEAFNGFERRKKVNDLFYVCMTQYDATMPKVSVAFPPDSLENTLGEYISSLGLKQLRIAETEKYAHVTFFFNGGVEAPNKNEDRILIPSPKVATYDLKPEMSAPLITEKVLEIIAENKYDLIILNFANADMVGHTGIMDAAIKAIETLNDCVPMIVDTVLSKNGQILLTADHGNADFMLDEKSNVVTAHSTNPVPLVFISNSPKELADCGVLADIAPTLLNIMGLPVPDSMSGKSLIK